MTDIDCRPAEDCLVLACDVAVRRALELASKRMLTRGFLLNQSLREVPQYLIYTKLPSVTETCKQDKVLAGAWTSLPEGLCTVAGLVDALDAYVRDLLAGVVAHDPEYLRPIIRRHL